MLTPGAGAWPLSRENPLWSLFTSVCWEGASRSWAWALRALQLSDQLPPGMGTWGRREIKRLLRMQEAREETGWVGQGKG